MVRRGVDVVGAMNQEDWSFDASGGGLWIGVIGGKPAVVFRALDCSGQQATRDERGRSLRDDRAEVGEGFGSDHGRDSRVIGCRLECDGSTKRHADEDYRARLQLVQDAL